MQSMQQLGAKRQALSPNDKRTNSLGWAASDCHTCARLGRICNRRRPRCDTCVAHHVRCGGYAQRLNWQDGIASRGKMKGRQLSVGVQDATPTQGHVDVSRPIVFHFVQERVPRKRKARMESHGTEHGLSERPSNDVHGDEPSSADSEHRPFSPGESVMDNVADSNERVSRCDTDAMALSRPLSWFNHLSSENFDQLSFFDWHFSKVTVTFDVQVNPWKSCLPVALSTPYLLNAVVAVSQRIRAHCVCRVEDVQVLELKETALSAFAENLSSSPSEALVATALSLIALEYADSGLSNWTIHLQGAYRILEARGGIAHASSNSVLRAQIAMLVWYDLTAALLSRAGPAFPQSYVYAIISWRSESPDQWSNLSLNGCPDDLLLAMHRIASAVPLASELDKHEVKSLETTLWAFLTRPRHERAPRPDVVDKDLIAGMEDCWRLSLILYLYQAFDLEPGQISRAELAKVILEVGASMPPNSHCQKQCLLPIILAGTEMSQTPDSCNWRLWIIEFLSRWNAFTGIWIFKTAHQFLERVWAVADSSAPASTGLWNSELGIMRRPSWTDLVPPRAADGYLFG